mmetsp:Transcript_23637/g.39568  ORF Transcript_23637/g.39568 Transcript_23637/m.39568 type:complete len:519 (+) Transcript_23637:104-1660(+)|eukprot:CAMPEP_0184673674 /NCGR_PEP_ID=MMETSP0308-20130426/86808_1 /TAXON_ID=38269 /ORGANISM="Gloeochaete witrockiana, Strain SAG 46.84" /LENGTH=518 /DNA_ID=CAMNT_0027121187 /DNA_START=834 /DNA_END=2390 /DNA_ORIENTATION=+
MGDNSETPEVPATEEAHAEGSGNGGAAGVRTRSSGPALETEQLPSIKRPRRKNLGTQSGDETSDGEGSQAPMTVSDSLRIQAVCLAVLARIRNGTYQGYIGDEEKVVERFSNASHILDLQERLSEFFDKREEELQLLFSATRPETKRDSSEFTSSERRVAPKASEIASPATHGPVTLPGGVSLRMGDAAADSASQSSGEAVSIAFLQATVESLKKDQERLTAHHEHALNRERDASTYAQLKAEYPDLERLFEDDEKAWKNGYELSVILEDGLKALERSTVDDASKKVMLAHLVQQAKFFWEQRQPRCLLAAALDLATGKGWSNAQIQARLKDIKSQIEMKDKFPGSPSEALAKWREGKFDRLARLQAEVVPGYEAWFKNLGKWTKPGKTEVVIDSHDHSSNSSSNPRTPGGRGNRGADYGNPFRSSGGSPGNNQGNSASTPQLTRAERRAAALAKGACPGCEWASKPGLSLQYVNCPNKDLFRSDGSTQDGRMAFRRALELRKKHAEPAASDSGSYPG